MAFWSGERLLQELPRLIDPFNADLIDCASYTLRIGHEVYISPTEGTMDPETKRVLRDGEGFVIPPGQFGFLLTEDTVSVPDDALAFISMKATIKFRGLVNVSGFHVDPGWRGQLTFAVFNAGPVRVHLQQGEKCFLIWYADLDRASREVKKQAIVKGINSQYITSVSGGLHSLAGLARRVGILEGRQPIIIALLASIAVALFVIVINIVLSSLRPPPQPVQVFVTQPTAAAHGAESARVSKSNPATPGPTMTH
jgi:dCTP deaminase